MYKRQNKQGIAQSLAAEGRMQAGDFPPVVLELHSLRELNLDHTGCRNIDERLGKLTNLKALQVSDSCPNVPGHPGIRLLALQTSPHV